ncbi:hypothetical protein SAMN04488498_10229 [Mesorhizobium albiziae]|uniref:Uncharacterized protein n=1 Tax=Neomesorhizobium albiziae TaxID=335020 RepID=A0A1I3W820_9HYPH|nr:hypothetical protein SAMN04488498_10229 [Mesorhizobium albiziae]
MRCEFGMIRDFRPVAHEVEAPPLRRAMRDTSPPAWGRGKAETLATFLSPVDRGRGAEQSEAEWGSILPSQGAFHAL